MIELLMGAAVIGLALLYRSGYDRGRRVWYAAGWEARSARSIEGRITEAFRAIRRGLVRVSDQVDAFALALKAMGR